MTRVLWAYQDHQPRWDGAQVLCLCGLQWGDFCPVLEDRLAALGENPRAGPQLPPHRPATAPRGPSRRREGVSQTKSERSHPIPIDSATAAKARSRAAFRLDERNLMTNKVEV